MILQRQTTESHLEKLKSVRRAALDQQQIDGLTHRFYRYPARFSPIFARACIEAFSRPGQVVLDPYMGGGTTVLEAMIAGRRSIGSDINTLSVFIARAKTSPLNRLERQAIAFWATSIVPELRCSGRAVEELISSIDSPRNMASPEVRWIKKTIALSVNAANEHLPTKRAQSFARCVLLNVGQWALNGRRSLPTAGEFRRRVAFTTKEMLSASKELSEALEGNSTQFRPLLRHNDAEHIYRDSKIQEVGLADLVVTSPPYPGVHMLYHRWQVDGRKETDAPYWIASCLDGSGASYYNFAGRKSAHSEDQYFEKVTNSFGAIRQVMKRGAVLAQMVAFADPDRQLRRYLTALNEAGFDEMRSPGQRRTWRSVPSRRWHANLKGVLASSKEVVLLHTAN